MYHSTGRERDARRYDTYLATTEFADALLRGGSIEASSAGPWQPTPTEVLIARVRSMPLHEYTPDRLDALVAIIEECARSLPASMRPSEDRAMLDATARKLRGQSRVSRYRASEQYRRISAAMLDALTMGAAAKEPHGITDEIEREWSAMYDLEIASAL